MDTAIASGVGALSPEVLPQIVPRQQLPRPTARAPAAPSRAPRCGPAFEGFGRRRTHDGLVLGGLFMLVSGLIGVGAWMAAEVGRGVAIAQACDGACSEARR
ncbi:hypothetical protein [Anaeromyxobacter oryzae]|uniref:Uncharacterized protein n=1 Tax=Anaeromyxobacter oryzae TaxID=2918170 RepID=A0ABN6MMF2_9BACT|nr:hypothetical protein [Anaeromyxobacter oryzae]BDG02228.1 hypothetical protein AMOR_12240 [Anaeromyxobacter oryzae]